MDYIFPDFVTKILKAPSPRTQMESSLVGITIMMLGSLGVITFMIATGIVTGFWFIFLVIASEIGVISFQASMLVQIYSTYRSYKLELGLYPKNYELQILLQQAEELTNKLEILIRDIKIENEKEL
jgi:sensor histidine kinase YesM